MLLLIICIFHLPHIVLAEDFDGRRSKRDDGSMLADSGGPVAQTSKSDANKKSDFGPLGEAAGKMDPCELDATKATSISTDQLSMKSAKNAFSMKDGMKSAKGMMKKGKKAKKEKGKKGKKGKKGGKKGKKGGSDEDSGDGQPSEKKIKEEFEKFKKDHEKSYSDPAAEAQALKTFGENYSTMLKLMGQRQSVYDASFRMTKHSDLSLLEFIKKLSGALPDIQFTPQMLDIKDLVKQRDCKAVHWQKFGVIPEPRLQEECGCCYAMASSDAIAAQYQIDKQEWDKTYQLSPQYLADCMPEPKAYKCKGGRATDMLNYLAECEDCAVPDETCYPYKDTNGTCESQKVTCDSAPKIKVKWAASFDISGPFEKELMAALLQHGPVIAIVGVTEGWQFYNGTGILKMWQCTMTQMHAVLITGYNYTTCVPTYYIKNSWGDDWGGRGAIKLEAGKSTCNVGKTVIVVCTADDCPKDKSQYLSYILSKNNYPDCQ